MKKQGYSNHRRYYTPHHFILYPVLLGLLIAIIKLMFDNPDSKTIWILFAALIIISSWISFMMRQHYALTLQNRVVRLEMRLRYYQLTGSRFDQYEEMLSFPQIAALRFSSDDELPSLLQKAVSERLAPSEIKKQIKNWKPDHMRV